MMDLKNQKIRQQNRDVTILLIPIVAVIAKLIQFFALPDKYFFDSWRMISMLTGKDFMASWGGYETTVNLYRKINIFNFVTVNQWSISLGIIMTIVVMIVISRTKEMMIRESIFVLMATGLLNIYVFSITKEMVQISFFFLIYFIICLPIQNTLIKLLGCVLIFYWESTFYRSYYIIMAAMAVFLYCIFIWLKKREKISKSMVFLALMLSFIAIFAFLYASKYVSYDDYISAINVRDDSINTGANTAIRNPITVNSNLGIFMFDYIVCAIRMMIPIELLIKSPVYAPFVIYQFFILYYFIKTLINIKKIDSSMVVVLSCFSAYLFGSFIFEPDFGSWVRHESATFPILQFMAFRSEAQEKYETLGMKKGTRLYEAKNA